MVNIFFFDLAAVIDIDTSGIHALEELYKSLLKRDIQVLNSNNIKMHALIEFDLSCMYKGVKRTCIN